MKKLILALSFVFALGLVAVNAQTPVKTPVKKEAAKPAVKPAAKPADKKAVKTKKTKKVVAPAKKEAAPVKK